MNYLIGLVLAAVVCAAGCSETNDSTNPGGAAGSGGEAGMGGADPNVADHLKLFECTGEGDMECERARDLDPYCQQSVGHGATFCVDASAQVAEGGMGFAMYRAACVLARLRDRMPGVYRLQLDHTHSSGSEGARYTFAITPSGMIERGVMEYAYIIQGDAPASPERFLPTERCEPKSPDFYDDCAELAFAAEGVVRARDDLIEGGWNCVFPDWSNPPGVPLTDPPWFSNCVPLPPTCE